MINVCETPGNMFRVNCAIKFVKSIQKQTTRDKVRDQTEPSTGTEVMPSFFKPDTLMINRELLQNWTDLADCSAAFRCLPSSLLQSASIRENQYLQSRQWEKLFLLVDIVCFLQTSLSCFNNPRLLKVTCQTAKTLVVGTLLEWFWATAKGLSLQPHFPNFWQIIWCWVLKDPFWCVHTIKVFGYTVTHP